MYPINTWPQQAASHEPKALSLILPGHYPARASIKPSMASLNPPQSIPDNDKIGPTPTFPSTWPNTHHQSFEPGQYAAKTNSAPKNKSPTSKLTLLIPGQGKHQAKWYKRRL